MANLEVTETTDSLTAVGLSGRLDVDGVQGVELKFNALTAARKRPAIVDLSGLEFIASLGIGMLIAAARTLRGHGANLVLLSPGGRVEEVLRAARIDEVIPIVSSREEALERLGLPPSR